MQRRTEVRGRGGEARVRGRWEREWCVGKMERRAMVYAGKIGKEGWGDKKMGKGTA